MSIFNKLFNRDLKKRQKEEPYPCPYENCSTVTIIDSVEHQNIGGKKAYVDRYVTLDDILNKLLDLNIAAVNFVMRRPDLFMVGQDDLDVILMDPWYKKNKDKLLMKKAKHLKYYYVKIWQVGGPFGAEGCYLGYFIASDECTEPVRPIAYKVWPEREEDNI